MYRLIVLLAGLAAASPAWAVCPSTPADCPSGTANNWTVANSLSVTGASTLSGGGTHAGTFTGGTFSGITLGGSITGTGATITGGTISGTDLGLGVVTATGSTTGRSLANRFAQMQYYDVRDWLNTPGASCGDWGTGANVDTAIQAMIAAGYKYIRIPAHCTWTPPTNSIADGVNILGADPNTSIVSVVNETTDTMTMGRNSSVSSVGTVTNFCYAGTPPGPLHKICPVFGTFWNTGNSTGAMNAWGPEINVLRLFPYTDVNGVTNTGGGNAFAVIENSKGSGDFYGNSFGENSFVLDAHTNGVNGAGVNVAVGDLDATVTDPHSGVIIQDYSYGSGSNSLISSLRIARRAAGTQVNTSLRIDDTAAAGNNYTTDVINVILGKQASGNFMRLFHSGSTFTGNEIELDGAASTGAFNGNFISITAATGAGTMGGNFEDYSAGGARVHQLDAKGRSYNAGGVLIGSAPFLTTMPFIAAQFAIENVKFTTAGDAVSKAAIQVIGSGSTTSDVRLLTDGSGTASATNCGNLTANNLTAIIHDIAFVATDITDPTKRYSYHLSSGQLARFTGALSTTWQGSASPEVYTSGVVAATTTLSADTTNSCLSIKWTPPGANTDTWHITGSYEMDSSQ